MPKKKPVESILTQPHDTHDSINIQHTYIHIGN